jgi:hypothetical protein
VDPSIRGSLEGSPDRGRLPHLMRPTLRRGETAWGRLDMRQSTKGVL